MPVAPIHPRAPDGPAPRHALRDVPYMGVIFVVAEAMKLGFQNGHPDWCNLGQGQPEVGDMEGAPPRIQSVEFQPEDHAYGPITGTDELRAVVAAHYNRLYRQGKRSQYGPQNVAIAQGGRLALSRALAALGQVTVGYKLPDYTAYEDMLDLHLSRVTPVALPGKEEDGFAFTPRLFEEALAEHHLGALLISNPCNPTGQVLAGDALRELLETAHKGRCTLLLDEFYSHFIYARGSDGSWGPGAGPVSAAAYIDDVDEDSVLLFDGLTKNHRYPGWRIGWAIGPSEMVETMSRVGSALDGGPSCVAQRAALAALEPEVADQETRAVRQVFSAKRNLLVERLSALGVRFPAEPSSTFYAWGCLADLPGELSDAMTFFRRALERKVLTVPGEFFDVNPGKQRTGPSPYTQWMRFSFGPPMDNLQLGLERLAELVNDAR
jgi:aspartate/methionine/tyrosine aminotransferase